MPREKPSHPSLYHYKGGCRCEECRAVNADRRARQRKAERLGLPTPQWGGDRSGFVEPEHPSQYHYRKKGCRCAGCKRAYADLRKSYPSYSKSLKTPVEVMPADKLAELRKLVGYDSNKNYDLMEEMGV